MAGVARSGCASVKLPFLGEVMRLEQSLRSWGGGLCLLRRREQGRSQFGGHPVTKVFSEADADGEDAEKLEQFSNEFPTSEVEILRSR